MQRSVVGAARVDIDVVVGERWAGRGIVVGVSVMSPSDEPLGLTVLPPDQALERARPVPQDEELVIEGLTEVEWEAFAKALADR